MANAYEDMKHGYVNKIDPKQKKAKGPGDNLEVVDLKNIDMMKPLN